VLIGIGTDIVSVARIERLYARWGARFLNRVYTLAEQAYCAQKAAKMLHLAGRFAGKEAVLKALGTGRVGAGFREIEILNDAHGRPYVLLRGRAAAAAELRGVRRLHLSIAHEGGAAVAFAVAEGGGAFFAPGYGPGDAGD